MTDDGCPMKVDGSLTILSKDKSLDTTIVAATVADPLLIPTIVSATDARLIILLRMDAQLM